MQQKVEREKQRYGRMSDTLVNLLERLLQIRKRKLEPTFVYPELWWLKGWTAGHASTSLLVILDDVQVVTHTQQYRGYVNDVTAGGSRCGYTR